VRRSLCRVGTIRARGGAANPLAERGDLIMDKMTLVNRHFLKDTRGANLVEYIILVGVVALIALAGYKFFGNKVTDKINEQGNSVGSINGVGQ
jgi:Flp pilus assembly pilin Flp